MIDYGLISLLLVQLALVFGVYHAWRGIKSEIAALVAMRTKIESYEVVISTLKDRQKDVEAAPKATMTRIGEVEAAAAKCVREIEDLRTKNLALNARISAFKRHAPKVEEDQDQAPEGEGTEQLTLYVPPASPNVAAPANGMPPGFGKLRKAG